MCVVDTGGRALTPSCSAKVAQGMDGRDRQRAGPPLAQAGAGAAGLVGGRGPGRAGAAGRDDRRVHGASTAPTRPGSGRRRPRPPPASATRATRATTTRRTGSAAETVAQPVKVDNEPVRPGLRDAASSATSASRRAAWTPRTRSRSPSPGAASTPASPPSTTSRCAESACVFCGNCINVCPTGALMFRSEYELRAGGHLGRGGPDASPTRSARTAAWAARSSCTSRTTGSSRCSRRRTRR